jgi:hypothetical protein
MPSQRCMGRVVLRSVAALALIGLGCSSLPVSARVARAEVTVAETLRSNASMASRQCRAQAAYSYYEGRLGLAPEGPGSPDETFSKWYDHALATDTLSFATYCERIAKSAEIYHAGVLSLRDYARAVLALAEGRTFDGTGFQQAATATADAARQLGDSGAVATTAKSIGDALNGLAGLVEQHVRAQNLRSLVGEAGPVVGRLVTNLIAYLDALEGQRAVIAHHRRILLGAADRARDGEGHLNAAADAALAFDLATEGDLQLTRAQFTLARDRELLKKTSAAHDSLTRLPWTEKAPDSLLAVLGELEAALTKTADAPPED